MPCLSSASATPSRSRFSLQVGNGTLYEGVFSAVRREGDDVGVMLKMARVLRDGEAPDKVHQGYIPELYICAAELVQVTILTRRCAQSLTALGGLTASHCLR